MSISRNLLMLLALTGSAFAQNGGKPVAERVALQNAVFDEQYESDLRNFPERATAYGDYRYNSKLADYSLAAIALRNKTNHDFLVRRSEERRVGKECRSRWSP